MAERHPRGDRPWRVRLSVGERNAGLLADWLAEREEYEHAEGSVDLWVVDPPGLREHADRIAAARAESDCYLPVLLVVPGRADGGGGTERTAALDRLDRDDLVDDVVETPTTGHELGRRFRTLLRARALSVEVTERERQYRELVETLPEAILIVRDGMVVYANEAAERLAGADADDLRGRGVESLFDAADRSAVAETVEAVEREGRAGEFVEVTVRDEGGAPVECDLTGVEVTYGDGPAVQLVVRDLSEQRERERRLRLFGRAIEEARQGITIADASQDDTPLVYVNPAFERITGYSAAEAVGRNCRFLQGEETDAETVAEVRAAIDAGRPVSVEIRNYRKDGTPFWNQLDVTPVTDEDGEVTHFIGLQRDVTERRERELDLERYETIVKTVAEPIFAVDGEGRVVEANGAAAEAFGRPREELLGMRSETLFDDETVETFRDAIPALRASDDNRMTADGAFLTAGGERRECEITVGLLQPEETTPQGAVVTVRDITDTRRRERAVEMLDRVLRHNLRNDLNVVIGQAEQIAAAPETATERAAEIAGTARTLMELGEIAREIEAVLRSETEHVAARDLVPAVRDSVSRASERFPDADIECTLPEAAPARVHDAIERVLDELIENAVTHNDSPTPEVRVSVTAGDPVTVRIADDGQGIDEGELLAIEEGHESPLTHATGLDLWLAHWTAEVSGGELVVGESDAGGAAVVLRFQNPSKASSTV